MLTQFWQRTGEGLATRWLEYLFRPALLFWGGGLLLVVFFRIGLTTTWDWLATRDLPTQVALLVASLLLVGLSSSLMEQLRFPFLRLLEGYWRPPLAWLAHPLRHWQWQRIKKGRDRWSKLISRRETQPLNYAEARELARLEIEGHYAPASLEDCLPTRLGNILRAAESAPRERYGLDVIICWPRLWLLLPQDVRQTLSDSRRVLDLRVELWVWGLCFLLWAIAWPWAVVIALGWMWGAYVLILNAARVYADLLEATFDLYRWNLYEAVRWEKPVVSGPAEIALGQRLSEFLWRGTSEVPVEYHGGPTSERVERAAGR